MTQSEKALKLHEEWNGKITTTPKCEVKSREDLAIAYTPGVAEPCKVIAANKEEAYRYTIKSNTVAVVSDGSAVLGLGNIGAEAAMPVMEGKAVLFKEFGGVNAFPICLDTQDTEEIIKTVVNIAPAFGGINLEDISAPRCFEIETRLKELLDIPVFHDDQHGTAIVVLSGIINALKVVNKEKEDCKVIVNGAGSAGIAITKLLLRYGFKDVTLCDKSGILSKNSKDLNWMQKEMMEVTNLSGKEGSLADAFVGADIFVGVSAPGIVTEEMVASMNRDGILFAMANPVPEIMPDVAKAAGELSPKFIAICGSPMPAMTGFDYSAAAEEIESQTGLTTFFVDTNGTHSYLQGAEGAFISIAKLFCREGKEKQANSVNIIGATPLDFSVNTSVSSIKKWLLDNGFSVQSCFAMDSSLDEISAAPQAAVSLVISSDGIAAAKYLFDTYGVPYVVGVPVGKSFSKKLSADLKRAVSEGVGINSCGEKAVENAHMMVC